MITLSKFKIDDISLLIKWFKKDHIRRYWVSILNLSDEEIYNKYEKRLKEGFIDMFIIKKNKIEIGYIQTYYLENTSKFKIHGVAKGIDLFIGDENFIGQGIGPATLKVLIKEYILTNNEVEYICIDPELRNTSAIRAYEKVGFQHVNTDINESYNLVTHYMILHRDHFS